MARGVSSLTVGARRPGHWRSTITHKFNRHSGGAIRFAALSLGLTGAKNGYYTQLIATVIVYRDRHGGRRKPSRAITVEKVPTIAATVAVIYQGPRCNGLINETGGYDRHWHVCQETGYSG